MDKPAVTQEVRSEIYEAFRKMKAKDYEGAETLLKDGLKKADGEKNPVDRALYYSTLGVLAKVKGDFKGAWRLYEKAEQLLPDDPSLKIIISRLLIDEFAQYDLAVKKMKKVLDIAKGSPTFEHQAHAILAVAYLKKGERKKALQMMQKSMEDDFQKIRSAENLNFEMVEAFLARNFEVALCRSYVEKALALARERREEKSEQFLNKLLESFDYS